MSEIEFEDEKNSYELRWDNFRSTPSMAKFLLKIRLVKNEESAFAYLIAVSIIFLLTALIFLIINFKSTKLNDSSLENLKTLGSAGNSAR